MIGCHDGNPKLLDSFAGGGSIPIEGTRIGMEAYASDINPIPILLNRLQLELLPNVSDDLITKAREKMQEINQAMKEELGHLYPNSSDEHVPIGYLCAREIVCEGVGCGVKFPLTSSPWVANSKTNKVCYSFSKDAESLTVDLIKNPTSA